MRRCCAVLLIVLLLMNSLPLPATGKYDDALEEKVYMSSYTFDTLNCIPSYSALRAVCKIEDMSIIGGDDVLLEYKNKKFMTISNNFTITSADSTDDTGYLVGPDGTLLMIKDHDCRRIYIGTKEYLHDVSIGDGVLVVGNKGTIILYKDGKFTTISSGLNIMFESVSWGNYNSYAWIMGISNDGRKAYIYKYNGSLSVFHTIHISSSTISHAQVALNPKEDDGVISIHINDRNTIIIHWDGTKFKEITRIKSVINDIDWSSDGSKCLLVGMEMIGKNGVIYEFSGDRLNVIDNSSIGALYGVNFVSKNKATAVGEYGRIYEIDDRIVIPLHVEKFNGLFNHIDVSPDKKNVLILDSMNSYVFLCDVEGNLKAKVRPIDSSGNIHKLFSCAWRPDGSYALAVGANGTLLMLTVQDDELSYTFLSSSTARNLFDVAWHPSGNYAIIVGERGTARRFDGTRCTPVPGAGSVDLRGIEFSPTGNFAIAVGGEVRYIYENASSPYPIDFIQYYFTVVKRYSNGKFTNVMNKATVEYGTILNDVSFFSSGKALIVGTNGFAYEYSGGRQLERVTSLTGDMTSVSCIDDRAVVTSNRIVLYYENGKTEYLKAPFRGFAYSVDWSNDVFFVACRQLGMKGIILKYIPNMPPSAVHLNAPYEITDSSVKISWSENEDWDFEKYEVQWSKKENFSEYDSLVITKRCDTCATITRLDADTLYHFRVVVYDQGNLSKESNKVSAKTLKKNMPPSAVKLKNPTNITDSSMTLTWSKNTDEDFDRYEVHVSINNFSSYCETARIYDRNSTTYNIINLQPSTTYYFRIRVYDYKGLWNDSNIVSGKTMMMNVPPIAVHLYAPNNITENSMHLSWSKNNDSDFSKYEIHMSKQSAFNLSNSTFLASISSQGTTEYAVKDLKPNTTYYFKVRVYDIKGLHNDSNEVNGTTLPPNYPPSPVTLYPPENITQSSMRLRWSKNYDDDFEKYVIYMDTKDEFVPSPQNTLSTIVERNITEYIVTELKANTTYYFTLRVYDDRGLFTQSKYVNATTHPNTPPSSVRLYPPTNITENSMELKWDKSKDDDFYVYKLHFSQQINFTPDDTNLVESFYDINETHATVDSLSPNTTYYFIIIIYDVGGLSNHSNIVNGTTLGPDLPPKAPYLADPYNITAHSMILEWTECPDEDFDRYELHKSTSPMFEVTPYTMVKSFSDRHETVWNVSGLEANRRYYFKVIVYDISGHFNISNEVNGKTLPENKKPIAVAGEDLEVYVGDVVELHGEGYDEDGKIVKYQWDFEGDGIWDWESEENGNTTYTYDEVGEYTAVFRVTDDDGASDEDTVNISVISRPIPNRAPIIEFLNDSIYGYVNEEVEFLVIAWDPDGNIVMYEWDFDGDGEIDETSRKVGNATYTYDEEGEYTATLTVTDDDGASTSKSIDVYITTPNRPPTAIISSPREKEKFYEGEMIEFDGSESYDPDGDKISYKWEDIKRGKLLGETSQVHITLKKGTYRIKLTVSDGELESYAEVNITVLEKPNELPTVKITEPYNNSVIKGRISIRGSAKDADGKITKVQVRVDFGQWKDATGTSSWSYFLDTTQLSNGIHKIYVRAYDDNDGCSATYYIIVNVQNEEKKEEKKTPLEPITLISIPTALYFLRRRKRKKY